MSEKKLLDQFDISLGEEVLNDVRASGKSFKKEIWESGIGGGLLGCIFLDKSEQDVLRVQVKVFNSGEPSKTEAAQIPTQESASQAVQVTEEKRQQTDTDQQENQFSQTDVNKQEEKTCQTPVAKLQETPMQTDIKQMAEKLSQTKVKEFRDMNIQTEQLKTQQRAMQVDPECGVGVASQTEPKKLHDSQAQTDPKPIREAIMQTDPKPLADKAVLATCTMTDMIMQTQYMGIEKQTQAQPSLCEAVAQTDIKTYRTIDIQAKPEIKDRNLQTSREFLRDVDCATDPMIIVDPEDQCENDCQTDPMRIIDPQTDRDAVVQTDDVKIIYPEFMYDNVTETDFVRCIDPNDELESSVQTDDVHIRNEEEQVENIAQTDDVYVGPILEMAEVETQTTLVWVCGLQQTEEDESNLVTKEASPPQAVSDVEIPLSQGSDVPFDSSQDTPSNSQPSPFQTPEKMRLSEDLDGGTPETEKYCQTDPVTIIIGDSSFLVNRLKDYASPPRGMGGIRTRGIRRRGGPMTRGGPMMRGGMTQRSVQSPPKLTPEGGFGAGDAEREMPVLQNEDTKPQKATVTPANPPIKPRGEGTYSGVRHRQLERADLIPASKSGRFNCPFCNLTFNESALLYRHLQLTHGTPRASNRRARRRGTIILLEDGRKIVENGNPRRASTGRRRGRRSAASVPPEDEELYQETDKYTVLQEPDYEEEPMPGEEFVEEGEMIEQEAHHESEVTTVHIQQGEDGEVTTLQVLEGDVTEDGQVIVRTTEEGEVLVQEQVEHQIEQEIEHEPQHHEVVHQEVVHHQEPEPETETINGPPEVPVTTPDPFDPAGASRRAFSCPFCPKNFTKSSALYVHLQNSHKGEKQRIRMPKGSRIKYPAAGTHEQYVVEQGVVEQEVEQEVVEQVVEEGEAEEGEVEPGEVEPGEVEPGEVEPGEVVLGEEEAPGIESDDEWPEREAELKEEKVKLEKDDDDTPRRGRGRPPKRKEVTPQGEEVTSPKRTRRSVEVAAERRSLRKK